MAWTDVRNQYTGNFDLDYGEANGGQWRADTGGWTSVQITLYCDTADGEADTDGDGVADDADACAETPTGEIVDADGCSIAQICPCENGWKNHGGYVSCVSNAATAFENAGLIESNQHGKITSAAAKSSCGQK
jgi:hypothetical protein